MPRLDPEAIREGMDPSDAWDVHVADEVASTNDAVLEIQNQSATSMGTALFAEDQTAGRGRRGHAWLGGSPGSNLLFSCRVRPAWPLLQWSRLTHLTALALKRTLEDFPALRPKVKWPNDLYLEDRKVAGILVETHTRGDGSADAVIGVGLNVNWAESDLPDGLRAPATSLRIETGLWVDREALAASVLEALREVLRAPAEAFESALDELRGAHYLLGREVSILMGSERRLATARDLGPEGELVVAWQADGRTEALSNVDEVRLVW